jgi:elongation of very long chain fatty acids protein 7
MDSIINSIYAGWRDLMDNKSDQRTSEWFLMSSPLPTAAICLTYAFCVKILGPKLMENRKPFKLREVLIVYNFLQVIFSSWLFYEAAMSGWFVGYSYRCQPVDHSRSPLGMRVSRTKFARFFAIRKNLLRRWQLVAGGTSSASSQSSSTQYSS